MIKRGELSAPLAVFLNVTNRCNLRCLHCSASAGQAQEAELTTAEWLALIRRLAELKVFRVTVTGGEPLVRPDLFLLLEELDQRGIGMTMNTNATLIDDEVAGRLAGFRMLRSFGVSLDGSCPAVHDRLRGTGAFDRALRGVEALLRQDPRVSIQAVVTRFNMDDLANMARLAWDLGARKIGFNALHPAGRTRTNMPDIFLSGEERRAVGERLAALQEEYGSFVNSAYPNWYRSLSDPPRRTTQQPSSILSCSAAKEGCGIRADGSVVPCTVTPDYVCGNVRENDFAWIWRHSPKMQAVRALSELTTNDVEGCRDCAYRFTCSSGCRADAWCLVGDWIGSPPAICWYYPDDREVSVVHG